MTDQDTLSRDDAVDRIWSLADSIDFCMFVTWDGERQRARPMSARVRRDAHRIYFLADEAGAKDDQIERFPTVTLAFSDPRAHDYVVITGRARVSDDRDKIRDLWSAAAMSLVGSSRVGALGREASSAASPSDSPAAVLPK